MTRTVKFNCKRRGLIRRSRTKKKKTLFSHHNSAIMSAEQVCHGLGLGVVLRCGVVQVGVSDDSECGFAKFPQGYQSHG